MSDNASFREAVRELVYAVIADRRSALASARLGTNVEIAPWNTEDSELRITFWRGDAFIDVVENFVISDGMPVSSIAEFSKWLEQSVDTIIEENREV